MADRIVKPDTGNDLVLQNDDGSGKIEINDDASINVTGQVDIDSGAIDGITLGTNSAVTEAQIDNININGNAIISSNTDGNIDITPNGTGEVNISKIDIDSGAIDGVTIGTNSVATDIRVDNLKLDGNSVTSTNTNGDINLTPDGTGSVVALNASNASTFKTTGGGTGETAFVDLGASSASNGNVMARIKGIRGGDTTGEIAFSVKSAANTITERLRISASGSITTPNSTEFNGTIGTSASGSANLPAVKTALNASGNAGIYACRAWVNFPGNTSSPTANADGNVDSISYNANGDYTINIDDDIDDANYAVMGCCTDNGSGGKHLEFTSLAGGSVRVKITRSNGTAAKTLESAIGVFVAIFR